MSQQAPSPFQMTMASYVVISVPEGCTQYTEGQTVRVTVPQPPPATISINAGGDCDGVIASLVQRQGGGQNQE